MQALLRWLIRIAFAVIVLLALVFVAARFHDGPLGPIPGGALASGEVVGQPVVDWSFARDIQEVELQLLSEDGSRTVWLLVEEGRAYVPCALGFPPGKRWYKEAVKDGRATLRVEGRRYPVTLTKIDDTALGERMGAEVQRKYGSPPPGEAGGVWIFQVNSRSDGAGDAG